MADGIRRARRGTKNAETGSSCGGTTAKQQQPDRGERGEKRFSAEYEIKIPGTITGEKREEGGGSRGPVKASNSGGLWIGST